MAKTPGTTLGNPVAEDHQPDLKGSLHEIQEYFADQGAYDLFDYLLKELLTKQPVDPVDHLLSCLKTEYPSGPLKVIVSSAPGLGRAALCKRLAAHFGLQYISAGQLLREHGTETHNIDHANEKMTSELVLERVQQAQANMQGFILDGFPRTRFQTSFLKENSVVPTHVLMLKVPVDTIRKRRQLIENGEIEGDMLSSEELEQKLRIYSCHSSSALETYKDKTEVVDMSISEEDAFWAAERAVRRLPRSRGPAPPPRVVLLGPRGIGVKEHAARLAARLGSVFIDGYELSGQETSQDQNEFGRSKTTLDLADFASAAAADDLGAVGVRLRQPDCNDLGWVMCGCPANRDIANILTKDARLKPLRVVALVASLDTCLQRLRHIFLDPVTGKVWTSIPKNEKIRKRLTRNPQDQPQAVTEMHADFTDNLPFILEALGTDGRCVRLDANRNPESVHRELVEFVERPLSLPARSSA